MVADLTLPDAQSFRGWLLQVMDILGVSPHRLSDVSGASKNAVRKFVSGDQADLRMNTASLIVHGAGLIASEQGKSLPAMPRPLLEAVRSGGELFSEASDA